MASQSRIADPASLREGFLAAQQSGGLPPSALRRWKDFDRLAALLSEDALASLTEDEAGALYRACGGARGREFRNNPVEEIRDSLDFLLYDTIKLEGRFHECVADEGAYKLHGAGKEFASFVLCLRDPRLFGVWNTGAERALRRLGPHPGTLNRGQWGVRYIDLLDALQRLAARFGLSDLAEADRFAAWTAQQKEPVSD